MRAQLELNLQPARIPARQLPAIIRLHAVLKRQGFNPDWRTSSDKGGDILIMPCLGVARRFLSEPLDDSERGIPATGTYENLCSRYSCGDLTVEVATYSEREADPELRRPAKCNKRGV